MRATASGLLLSACLLPALAFSAPQHACFDSSTGSGSSGRTRFPAVATAALPPRYCRLKFSAVNDWQPAMDASGTVASATQLSGGAAAAAAAAPAKKTTFGLASSWGVISVLAIFGNAVRRLGPMAIEPLKTGGLTNLQWGFYVSSFVFIGYLKGDRAIRRKFSPHVVQRALTLDEEPKVLRLVLAGPYCMGLFHANRRRKAASWGMMVAAVGLIKIIKKLPYPWRSIVDAGVLAGIGWGGCAVAFYWVRSWFGHSPGVDPQLPDKERKP